MAWRRGALRNGEDGPPPAVLPDPLERDDSVDQGEQGVVPPHADVSPRVHGRAPLAEDDRSGVHGLPAVRLDAEPLALAVPSVPGTADSLFVCHIRTFPPGGLPHPDFLDRKPGERLAVSPLPRVPLALLVLVDDDLLPLPVAPGDADEPRVLDS